MDTKAFAAAITTIDAQLEILKAVCGLPQETGEELEEVEEPTTKSVGRGRKKRTVPTLEEEDDD